MHHRRSSILVLASASLIALALAACGGDDSSDEDSGNSPASSADVVSTRSIDGVGTVLVDSQDAPLYTNDQDRGSKVACTEECASIWIPLAAPSGGQPAAEDSAIAAKLGTVRRPDGTRQLTFGGKPLYTFVEDQPGQVTGDGFTDSFGGTMFTWTVATVTGAASEPSETTTSESSDASPSGGYGGY